MVEQGTADHQAESLTDITEHGTENKGIGQCYEDGRVDLVVRRKTVHTNE